MSHILWWNVCFVDFALGCNKCKFGVEGWGWGFCIPKIIKTLTRFWWRITPWSSADGFHLRRVKKQWYGRVNALTQVHFDSCCTLRLWLLHEYIKTQTAQIMDVQKCETLKDYPFLDHSKCLYFIFSVSLIPPLRPWLK